MTTNATHTSQTPPARPLDELLEQAADLVVEIVDTKGWTASAALDQIAKMVAEVLSAG